MSRDQLQGEVFSTEELGQIREAVKMKFRQVSQTAAGKFSYLTGREGALHLGYDEAVLDQMEAELLDSFCGVGNPFLIEPIETDSAVLDVGCGAGIDLLVAAGIVGPAGRVCGIDLTEEMVNKAVASVHRAGYSNIEIMQVDGEDIPYGDGTFDIALSNGVINLSPRKLQLFREIRRVLKPGGRLQFADIVLDRQLPQEMSGTLEAWSQ